MSDLRGVIARVIDVQLVQWLSRLSNTQTVPGSNPGLNIFYYHPSILIMNTHSLADHRQVAPWPAIEQEFIDLYRSLQPHPQPSLSQPNPSIHSRLTKRHPMSAPFHRFRNVKAPRSYTEQNATSLKRYYYALYGQNKNDPTKHPQLFQRYPQATVLRKNKQNKTCGSEPESTLPDRVSISKKIEGIERFTYDVIHRLSEQAKAKRCSFTAFVELNKKLEKQQNRRVQSQNSISSEKIPSKFGVKSPEEINQKQLKLRTRVSTVNMMTRDSDSAPRQGRSRMGLTQLRGSRKYKAMTQWMDEGNA